MSLQQKAFKGIIWSLLQNWGSRIINVAIFFLLAYLLDPKVFGLVALANLFLGFVQVFIDQGFSRAIIQRKDLDPEHLDTAFWTNLGIGSFLTVFNIVAAPAIGAWFNEPQIIPVIRWLSINSLLISLNGVQSAILVRQFGFKLLAMRTLLASTISGVVGVTMAFLGFGVWSLVVQQLVRNSIAVLLLWNVRDWNPGFRVSGKHFKELYSFGMSITGMDLLAFLNNQTDNLLIGKFLGSTALGYYNVAYQALVMIDQMLQGAFAQVGLTTFSRLQSDPEKSKRWFYGTTQLLSFFTFPMFFGIALLSPELVQSFFGDKWLPSVPVMQVLAVLGIVKSFFSLNGIIITAMGKPSWNLKLLLVTTAANIAAFAIAVQWGIVAVAVGRLISTGLLAPIRLWVTRRLINFKVSEYLERYVAPLTASIVMAIAIWGTKYLLQDNLITQILLILCIVLGALAYIGTVALIAPKLIQQTFELAGLSKLLKKSKSRPRDLETQDDPNPDIEFNLPKEHEQN
jgi:PST family polysaccharide transporter